MWISRKEFKSLVERVEALENFAKDGDSVNFTVYKRCDPFMSWREIACQKISVKEAIERVMSHLGLRMEYVEGKPATVAFTPVPNPQWRKK